MKRILQLLFWLAFTGHLFAQIDVTDFFKKENDIDARVNFSKTDKYGKKCAIIKVETNETALKWDVDPDSYIVDAQPKTAEWWIYIPSGTKRLIISHESLGKKDYSFPKPIESNVVYRLVLTTGKVITTVEEETTLQDIEINATPTDALIYIDNIYKQTGRYKGKLKLGKHFLRFEAPFYYTGNDTIEITNVAIKREINLKPAFGHISVSSKPESGAKVIIDGKELSKTTPCQSEKLESGVHKVMVIKEMYEPKDTSVTVTDGQITPIDFNLIPTFADITITAKESKIYINSEFKDKDKWIGRLNSGDYLVEAKRTNHRDAKKEITVNVGKKDSIDLQPTPINGTLDVKTFPPDATITINNKDYGSTPNTIKDLLIGKYTVKLSKEGYKTLSKTVTIEEEKTSTLNDTLYNGRLVSILSKPDTTQLYIDEKLIGKTPYKGNLTFGNHTLRIEKDERKDEKTVTIPENGGESTFSLTLPSKVIKEKINKPTEIIQNQPTERNINVYSTPTNATLYIDGLQVGKTPYSGNLQLGKHTLRVDKNGNTAEKNIWILSTGGETNFNLKIEQQSFTSNSDQKVETFHAPKTTLFYIAPGITYPLVQKTTGSILGNGIGYELKAGVLITKSLGVYAKFASNFSTTTPEYTIDNIPTENYYDIDNTTSVTSYSRMGIVGGAMLNLKPIILYAGAGWGQYKHFVKANLYNYSDNSFVKSFTLSDKGSYSGLETNAGIIVYKKPFSISIGVSSIQFKYNELSLSFGLLF